MTFLRSTRCRFLLASTVFFLLGAAVFSCPLKTPDFIWAAPVALGIVLLIFNFGRFESRTGVAVKEWHLKDWQHASGI